MKLNKGGAEGGGRPQGKQRKRGREEVFLLLCFVWFFFFLLLLLYWCLGTRGPHHDGSPPQRRGTVLWGRIERVAKGREKNQQAPWPSRAECTWIINLITNKNKAIHYIHTTEQIFTTQRSNYLFFGGCL